MSQQQVLNLKIPDSWDFDTLIPGANAAVLGQLRAAAAKLPHEFYLIFGAHGCGKSHVLCALASELQRAGRHCFFLDLGRAVGLSPELLDAGAPEAALLDNVDAVAGNPEWELALFAFFNRWYDRRHGLLILSSTASFDAIPYLRADLNSRLGSGIMLPLEPLDEAGCAEALRRRAAARGFKLPRGTCEYLVRRCGRYMPELAAILDRLDEEQLRLPHVLTIPFVKKVLGWESQ